MKIIIIKPPISTDILFGKIKDVGNSQQPLGIAYIASYLREKGHKIEIIDALVLNLNVEKIINRIIDFNPDFVAISSNTVDFTSTLVLVEKIKEQTKKLIVIGGPHVTAIPEDVMKHKYFDVGVIGEGEITILKLVENFNHNKFNNLKKINGIAYREKNRIIVNKQIEYIENLDELPFPARDLLPPITIYKPTPASCRKFPLGSIITSRGCPFKCTYCDRSVFGNKVRLRSPKNIIKEIEELKNKYKVKEIKIWDDIFNIDNERVIDICKLLIKKEIKLSWTCICRLNFINEEQIYWMKKAGCWQISVGIESGNDKILKKIKKGLTVASIRQKVDIIVKGGIKVRGFFMIGMPGENKETIMDTINFAKNLPLDTASFCIMTPYPNTEIYNEYAVSVPSWDLLRQNDPDTIVFCPEGLSKKELKYFFNLAYRSFYLRPSYIFKKLLELKNWYTLKSYFASLKSLLRL